MIYVTKLNHDQIMVNCELIETIEETPDTIITLTTNKKYVVKESIKEIYDKVVAYKKAIARDIFDKN